MVKRNIIYAIIVATVFITFYSCKTYYFRSNYKDVNSLLHETRNLQTKPFLKAHLKNGDICILRDNWKADTSLNTVSGTGTRYDFNRNLVFEGAISIPLDSVYIFETNNKIIKPEASRVTALSIMAGVDVVVGIICLTVPKACFGSCPTFYINENDNFHYADAEGFTNAIAPSLEYADIDALDNKALSSHLFSITMKNEALETHCIKDVKILAYPRKAGERIYQSPADDFYLCRNHYMLSKANGEEGDITQLLKNNDRQERFSLSDENNLNSKEEIFLSFNDVYNPKGLGLVINFRQSLMNTYLFYKALGYMGNEVGDVFAMMENREDLREKFDTTNTLLGNIEVFQWNAQLNKWEFQGHVAETGPIAINKQILPLKTISGSDIKIKLVMNKGLWRLDYLGLTNIIQKVKPVEISPNLIYNKGKVDNSALNLILNPAEYLVSMPGSEYKFNFILPDENADYELFLYSKGYYLEWMREHWIKDKDLISLKQMVINPGRYLRLEAKEYKQYETTMEQEFWNSRIDTKTFSYNAN